MVKREVKHAVEVKYDTETKIDALHWDDFIHEVKCTFFEKENDYYAVFEDVDEEDDHDRRKYAVYLHSTGELLCLVADSGLVLDCCYEDVDYRDRRNELYKQIALLAGWPESMCDLNVGMTWRQLIKKLNDELPKEFLDTPAYVWRPDYGGTIAAVKGIMPWCEYYLGDAVPGPGAPDYNVFFINNSLDDEE